MNCPVCKESMVILELNEVEIDYCTGCDGIWLDSGELELLLEDNKEKEKLLSTLKVDPSHPEKPNNCPICSKKMEKIYIGNNREVLIDRCVKGHGLWFDKGELKAVLEMGTGEESKVLNHLKKMFEYSARG